MSLTLAPSPVQQFEDANGVPYAGALLFFYASGTTTKLDAYANASGSVALNNPSTLSASGTITIYLAPAAYKFVLAPAGDTDPPTSPIWTVDPVNAVPETAVDLDIQGVAGELTASGSAVYLSSGSGGTTAGRWYKTTSATAAGSIAALAVGMTPLSIAAGETGTIRIAGRVTGLAGLTEGLAYYATTPAGTLTSTAPANARVIGVADSTTSLVLAEKRTDDIRRVASFQTITGNVGAGEDTIATYSAGAEAIYALGMGWNVWYYGRTANNANTKTLRLRLIDASGNNTVLSSSALTINEAGQWNLQCQIRRVSATVFSAGAFVVSGPANAAATFVAGNVTQGGGCVFADSCEIRLTAEATTNDDLVVTGGLVTRVGFGP